MLLQIYFVQTSHPRVTEKERKGNCNLILNLFYFSLVHAHCGPVRLWHSERVEGIAVGLPSASFLPTRLQPGGCFLSTVSFNLCYFCPAYAGNSHLNRHAQYHTLTKTQQRTITQYAHFSITHTHTHHSLYLLVLDIWCDWSPLRPTLRLLAVMSSPSLLPHCPISFSAIMRASFTFGLVQRIKKQQPCLYTSNRTA